MNKPKFEWKFEYKDYGDRFSVTTLILSFSIGSFMVEEREDLKNDDLSPENAKERISELKKDIVKKFFENRQRILRIAAILYTETGEDKEILKELEETLLTEKQK